MPNIPGKGWQYLAPPKGEDCVYLTWGQLGKQPLAAGIGLGGVQGPSDLHSFLPGLPPLLMCDLW